MNRIFHTRITPYQYLFLILVGFLTFWMLWQKFIIPATACALLLVFFIERFIHTTYTITTDGSLVLHWGRFSKKKTIAIGKIISVEKKYILKIGGFCLTSYLLIHYEGNKYISVLPVKEREFINTIEKEQSKFYNKEK